MVFPLLAGMLAGSSAMGALYGSGKAIDNYRFWSDYHRNTGVNVKYPWRAGAYDDLAWGSRSMRSGAMFGYTSYGIYHLYRK